MKTLQAWKLPSMGENACHVWNAAEQTPDLNANHYSHVLSAKHEVTNSHARYNCF